MKSPRLLLVAIVAALALTLAACGGDDDNGGGDGGGADAGAGGDLPVVRMQGLPVDPAAIPMLVMQEKGLDEKHGFKAEFVEVDPDAAANTLLIGESDIAMEQDAVTMTLAQQEGEEIFRTLYPDGGYPANTLLVIDRLVKPEFLIEIEALAHVGDSAIG